jgi:hypothetical protein
MSQQDKIKLGVAIVVLLGAGILIYFNLRDPKPVNPATIPGAPTPVQPAAAPVPPGKPKSTGAQTAPEPEPVPGNRRIYRGK